MKYWMQLVKTCSRKILKTLLKILKTNVYTVFYETFYTMLFWNFLEHYLTMVKHKWFTSISITCSCWMTLVSSEKALNFLKNFISTAICNNTFYSVHPSVCLSICQSIRPSCLSFHLSVSFLWNWPISFFWKLPWC